MKEYIEPTDVLACDHPKDIAVTQEAIKDETDPIKKASLLFNRIRDGIAYDPYVAFYKPEHYRTSYLLEKGRGYCVCKACALCTVGRAAGIPSRLGFATIRNQGATETVVEMLGSDLFVYHGYTEFFLNDKWVKATPAFDRPVVEKHNIPLPEFDGVNDCVMPKTDLAGNPYVEYVEHHGIHADLPLDELLEGWEKVYGKERMKLWIEVLEATPEDNLVQESF